MVIATQNPLDFEGVYPLPESEMDRFMLRVEFGYPKRDVEVQILKRNLTDLDLEEVKTVVNPAGLIEYFKIVDSVKVSDEILEYVSQLALQTREDSRLSLGVSPRAVVQLVQVARANACLEGRSYVIPDDIKRLATFGLAHRMRLDRSAALKGLAQNTTSIVQQVLNEVKPPR